METFHGKVFELLVKKYLTIFMYVYVVFKLRNYSRHLPNCKLCPHVSVALSQTILSSFNYFFSMTIPLQGGMGPSVIMAPQIAPPDYCGMAWFACLFCFWPTGICAILKSNEVRGKEAMVTLLGY